MLLVAVFLLAAQPAADAPAAPKKSVPNFRAAEARRPVCQTQVIQTDSPQARLNRPVGGGIDRRPHQGEPTFLVSAVERTVDGCPVPVARVRHGQGAAQPDQGKAPR